ncbi:hypothetical protein [Paenibacillus pabuli]|uniref:hypothetical protein n=1 Tax=Paenibacillus pabuli TaxID=1472 RepID=UPI003CF7633C
MVQLIWLVPGAGDKPEPAPMKKSVGNFDKLIIETGDKSNLNMGVAVIYLYRYVIFQMIDKIAMLSQLSVVFAQNPLTFLG